MKFWAGGSGKHRIARAVMAGAFVFGLQIILRICAFPGPDLTLRVSLPQIGILFAALLCGVPGGLIATGICAVFVEFFLPGSAVGFDRFGASGVVDVAIFCLLGIAITMLAEGFRRRSGLGSRGDQRDDAAKRWGAALAHSSDSIYVLGSNGEIVECSEAAAKAIAAYGTSDMSEGFRRMQADIDLFSMQGELLPFQSWPSELALHGLSGESVPLRIRRKGRLDSILVSLSYGPLKDAEGRITGALIASRDITELIRAREAAREEERRVQRARDEASARWAAALSGTPSAIILVDKNLNLLEFNESAVPFHRFKHPSEMPANAEDFTSRIGFFTMDGKPTTEETDPARRALRGESGHNVLLRAVRKDTQESWIASLSFSPVRDADGKVNGALFIATDVTEQIENAEAARDAEKRVLRAREEASARYLDVLERTVAIRTRELQASETRYRELFQNSPVGKLRLSAEGRVIEANPAACSMLGITIDEFLSRSNSDAGWKAVTEDGSPLRDEDRPTMASLRTGVVLRDVVIGVGDDDQRTWVSVNTYPEFNAGLATPSGVVAAFTDVTERVRRERAVRDSAQRFASLVESTPHEIAVWSCDLKGIIVHFGPGAEAMLGYTSSEVVGVMRADAFHLPGEIDSFKAELLEGGPEGLTAAEILSQGLQKRGTMTRRWSYQRKDGSVFPALAYISAVRSASGEVIGFMSSVQDISAQEKMADSLRRSARTDDLTGLLRRGAFMEGLEAEFHRIKRNKRPATLLVMDLDKFKAVNDCFGHAAGDQLLKDVGQLLKNHLRLTDLIGRLGGDEFVILLPETALGDAETICRMIQQRMRALQIDGGDGSLCVSASIGVALIDEEEPSTSGAIQRADVNLYRSKAAGGDRYFFSDVALPDALTNPAAKAMPDRPAE